MNNETATMIENYLAEKRTLNVHNSDHTTRKYRNDLIKWFTFLNGQNCGMNIAAKNFIAFLHESGANSKQIKTNLHILNNYYMFNDLPENPFEKLAKDYKLNKKEMGFKAISRDELVMSEDEVSKIIKRAWDRTKSSAKFYAAYRDAFMIDMLAEYGLRISALIGINIADVDLDGRCIYIRESKNQNPYVIPIINKIHMVNDYLRIYFNKAGHPLGRMSDDTRPLLVSDNEQRISDSTARRCVNSAFARVGLYADQRSTHQLRHYRATRYYREGMSTELISQIMGMSVDTLKKTYLHIGHSDIVDQYEKWNVTGKQQFECPACGYKAGNKGHEKKSLIRLLNKE